MAKSMAVRVLEGRLAVLVIGESAPHGADWEQAIDMMRRNVHDRALIVTAGGTPTARQRQLILEAGRTPEGKQREIPTAVITDSVLVRGVATAVAWFVPEVRAFAPRELAQALAYLHARTPIASVEQTIEELRRELK